MDLACHAKEGGCGGGALKHSWTSSKRSSSLHYDDMGQSAYTVTPCISAPISFICYNQTFVISNAYFLTQNLVGNILYIVQVASSHAKLRGKVRTGATRNKGYASGIGMKGKNLP